MLRSACVTLCTTIRVRVADKRYLILVLLRFFHDTSFHNYPLVILAIDNSRKHHFWFFFLLKSLLQNNNANLAHEDFRAVSEPAKCISPLCNNIWCFQEIARSSWLAKLLDSVENPPLGWSRKNIMSAEFLFLTLPVSEALKLTIALISKTILMSCWVSHWIGHVVINTL